MNSAIQVSPVALYNVFGKGENPMKMPDKIINDMLAPCGMNCMVCYLHVGTRKLGKRCPGCFSGDDGTPKHCRTCRIKDCTKAKDVAYCYECGEFPCKLVKNLEKSYNTRYNESIVNNSLYVREHGIEKFMQAEKSKWACHSCGGVISLHDAYCSECGAEYQRK